MSTLSSKGILKDLHDIYFLALDKGQYSVALKVKELLGKEVGLFSPKTKAVDKTKAFLDALSDEDLARLIEDLETKFKGEPV